jgi:group I intron endonuclease
LNLSSINNTPNIENNAILSNSLEDILYFQMRDIIIPILLFISSIIVAKRIISFFKSTSFENKKSEFKLLDAPVSWGLYFQDGASPSFEGIVDLHNRIMFYLVVILFGVSWILLSLLINFNKSNNNLVYRHLNHGKCVPIQKYSKFDNVVLKNKMFIFRHCYATISGNNLYKNDINQIKIYEDTYIMRKDILKENKGKSDIYMLTNKLTKDIYIGQSIDISKRFKKYFSISYIKSKDSFIISRGLIKYGYSNFSLTILEYCGRSDLNIREQYYFDKLKPKYNILKTAGSSQGFKHSEKTKSKISKSLKGIYIKEKSALFGRTQIEATKKLMSLKKVKDKNPLFGKTHNKDTIDLMRQKALGRIHSEETKLKISIARGNIVNIYEKSSLEEFRLIGSFVSARKAGKFLGISSSTIRKYKNSGEIFKGRYKFSS